MQEEQPPRTGLLLHSPRLVARRLCPQGFTALFDVFAKQCLLVNVYNDNEVSVCLFIEYACLSFYFLMHLRYSVSLS